MWGSCSLLLGIWFLPSDMASSIGVGEVTGSSSTTSNMEASNRSSLSIRGSRHLQRSQTALLSIPGGALNSLVHCWRAQASATILSCLTTQMSLGSWSVEGEGDRKYWHPKLTRLGGAFHQLDFSHWAVGSLKAAACFWASSWTWPSLSGPSPLWQRDQNSGHQVGSSFLSVQ